MDVHTVGILSTFTGLGMLDTAVKIALEARGIDTHVLCYCEWEAAASAALVARMEAKGLDKAPLWDDIRTFDGRPWRGSTGILTAGAPCQPYSVAGRRKGNTDERSFGAGSGPLEHLIRVIGESGPAVVFLENVSAWLTDGHFRLFGEKLSELGYEIKDPIFLASEDVGASHERERIFIMAYSVNNGDTGINGFDQRTEGTGEKRGEDSFRVGQTRDGSNELALSKSGRRGKQSRIVKGARKGRASQPSRIGNELAYTIGDGAGSAHGKKGGKTDKRRSGQKERKGSGIRSNASDSIDSVAHTRSEGLQGDEREEPLSGERTGPHGATSELSSELGNTAGRLYPPGRDAFRSWASVIGLDPTKAPAIESGLSVVADGLAFANTDLLRIGGNGVDPLVGAIAFGILWDGLPKIMLDR